MSRLVDIDNYLVLENGTIKETSFKQDIQIQNQTLMINEDAKVQIIYKTTEEGTYQFNIEIKDRLHVDLVEMYEASKSCSYTKNIKINESSEVLRYVEKNSHQTHIRAQGQIAAGLDAAEDALAGGVVGLLHGKDLVSVVISDREGKKTPILTRIAQEWKKCKNPVEIPAECFIEIFLLL